MQAHLRRDPRSPDDPNIILSVTSPNYAALDRGDDIDAAIAKTYASERDADKGVVARGSMRKQLGSQLIRELVLQ